MEPSENMTGRSCAQTPRNSESFQNIINSVSTRMDLRAMNHFFRYGIVYGVCIREDESVEWICTGQAANFSSTFSSIGTTWIGENTVWLQGRVSPVHICRCPLVALMSFYQTESVLSYSRNRVAESVLYALGFHIDGEIKGPICICGTEDKSVTPKPISRAIQERLDKGIQEAKKRAENPWNEITRFQATDLALMNPDAIAEDPKIAAIQQAISLSCLDEFQEYEDILEPYRRERAYPEPRIPSPTRVQVPAANSAYMDRYREDNGATTGPSSQRNVNDLKQ
jgi:hypothetical protein